MNFTWGMELWGDDDSVIGGPGPYGATERFSAVGLSSEAFDAVGESSEAFNAVGLSSEAFDAVG